MPLTPEQQTFGGTLAGRCCGVGQCCKAAGDLPILGERHAHLLVCSRPWVVMGRSATVAERWLMMPLCGDGYVRCEITALCGHTTFASNVNKFRTNWTQIWTLWTQNLSYLEVFGSIWNSWKPKLFGNRFGEICALAKLLLDAILIPASSAKNINQGRSAMTRPITPSFHVFWHQT